MRIVTKSLLELWLGVLTPYMLLTVIFSYRRGARGPGAPVFPWMYFLLFWCASLVAIVVWAIRSNCSFRAACYDLFHAARSRTGGGCREWALLLLILTQAASLLGIVWLW